MATYKELLAQRDKLTAEIEKRRTEERDTIIADIRQKMADYQITADEINGKRTGRRQGNRSAVAAKYRDPASGKEWSGRGKPPAWIKDASNRDIFLIR
ncbi:H-NS histone family protein [Burkholderia glumae]|uniref:H-NS histone family protein n=1 Tax=Burkholderia glumae TaxID=337 RepID=UPI001463478C|nr:H-NS histone family protein [Burkholderia glumae]QJP73792.1 H-NS histone family protein [Burkholderia glumae]